MPSRVDDEKDSSMTISVLKAAVLELVRACEPLPKTIWVAYSGGLDSYLLLWVVVQLRSTLNIPFKAIHVHHGLQTEADAWAGHCQVVCESLSVPLLIEHAGVGEQVDKTGAAKGLEALARELRYAAFAKWVGAKDLLLLGHHLNDQAETVLLRLVRGTGVEGMAGMVGLCSNPVLCPGYIGRPWLKISKQVLREQALALGLKWVEDESNEDLRFDRNYIRHVLLPGIFNRWPSGLQALGRLAQLSGEHQAVLSGYLSESLCTLVDTKTAALRLDLLQQYEHIRQKALLRHWLITHTGIYPSHTLIEEIMQTVMGARKDAQPCVRWSQWQIRRYQQSLYILLAVQPPVPESKEWNCAQGVDMPWGERIIKWQGSDCESLQQLGLGRVRVQSRQVGQVESMTKSVNKRLKKIFQEHAVPPWQRDLWPLLFDSHQKLVSVPGLWQADCITSTFSGIKKVGFFWI